MADPKAKTEPGARVLAELAPTVTPPHRDGVRAVHVEPVLDSRRERYEARGVLGHGGMGEVRLLEDARIGREVAQKVMRPDVASTPATVERFLREARVQGQLEHPSVVPVYDLGVEQGAPFFTMKRVRGSTLHEVLARLAGGDEETQRRYSTRRLLGAFGQVCLAVDFAHARGVLHRDLKPSNVMLGDFGEVHVLDWGLARVHGEVEVPLATAPIGATEAGAVMGTPGYLSPEQARGDGAALGPWSDVYSLGAMLFELLTWEGFTPGDTPSARVRATLSGFERRAQVRVPTREVPPELDAIIQRATDPRPHARHQTARELADAVERYLDGDRDLARRAELANGLVAQARARLELAEAGAPTARAELMREVTRALGLVPDHPEALALLGQLLAQSPSTLPPEAEAEMREALARGRGGVARTAAVRYLIWVAFIPFVWAMGVRSWPLAGTCIAALLLSVGLALLLRRRGSMGTAASLWLLAVSSVALGLVSFLVGPFVLVPALAATNTMFFASYLPSGRRRYAVAGGLGAVLVPLALELLGVAPPSYVVAVNGITLLPRMASFDPVPTEAVVMLGSLAAILTPSVLVGRLRDSLADAERRLFLHAWHARQLLQGQTAVVAGEARRE